MLPSGVCCEGGEAVSDVDAAGARQPRMRIGLALDWGTERTTLDHLLREFLPLIQLAERYGFDSLWLGQHFPTGPDMFHLPSPLVAMAAVARTRRWRSGLGCCCCRSGIRSRWPTRAQCWTSCAAGGWCWAWGSGARAIGTSSGCRAR